jgi:hypothetical protein
MKNHNDTKHTQSKAVFGTQGDFNYAVKINALERNDFFHQPFGAALSDMQRLRIFMANAATKYVGAKGKSTMPAVKRWIKENKPAEFYAIWRKDSTFWKDDVVEIYVIPK